MCGVFVTSGLCKSTSLCTRFSYPEAVASVWSLPHTRPLPNHGLYLRLPVFPVRPILWERLVGHPRVHPAFGGSNGEDDKVQDIPGLPAFVPQNLQLHPLQSPPRQPRRTHFQGKRPAVGVASMSGDSDFTGIMRAENLPEGSGPQQDCSTFDQ